MKPEGMVIYFHACGYRVPDLNENDNRVYLNGNNWNEFNDNRHSFGIALAQDNKLMPTTYNNLYNKIISLGNLTLAWRKARKGKTQKDYQKNNAPPHTLVWSLIGTCFLDVRRALQPKGWS